MIDDTHVEAVSVEKITADDINTIRKMHNDVFFHICMFDDFERFKYFDYGYSVKLMLDDKMIGFYLLEPLDIKDSDKSVIAAEINLDIFDGLKGIEGVSLLIDEKYRGRGYGEILKSYPKIMGYDYVYGGQAKQLNNLKHWLKRRFLVGKLGDYEWDNGYYLTAEIFK